jgi:hypothetical protein
LSFKFYELVCFHVFLLALFRTDESCLRVCARARAVRVNLCICIYLYLCLCLFVCVYLCAGASFRWTRWQQLGLPATYGTK